MPKSDNKDKISYHQRSRLDDLRRRSGWIDMDNGVVTKRKKQPRTAAENLYMRERAALDVLKHLNETLAALDNVACGEMDANLAKEVESVKASEARVLAEVNELRLMELDLREEELKTEDENKRVAALPETRLDARAKELRQAAARAGTMTNPAISADLQQPVDLGKELEEAAKSLEATATRMRKAGTSDE